MDLVGQYIAVHETRVVTTPLSGNTQQTVGPLADIQSVVSDNGNV